MKIGRRLRVYLIGVLMGLIATYFILGTRSCDWLPGKRVKTFIIENQIKISDFNSCRMACYGLNRIDIFNVLNSGSVSFSDSKTSGDQKEYIIEHEGLSVTFAVSMTDSTSEVVQFHDRSKQCNCDDSSETELSVLYEPNDLVLERLRENGFALTSKNECQFACTGIDSAYASSVLKKGFVLNDRSFPRRNPNPVYTIRLVKGISDTLIFVVEEGFKTRILEISSSADDFGCNCD